MILLKTINKISKIAFVCLLLLIISTSLIADLSSCSPTINSHIHTGEWERDNVGYPGGLSSTNPSIAETLYVDDYDSPQEAINYADPNLITHIIFGSGTYVLNDTLKINSSNIILKGEHAFKNDKDWADRTILEFDLDDEDINCIEIIGNDETLYDVGVEDLYIKRIDTAGDPGGTQKGNNIRNYV